MNQARRATVARTARFAGIGLHTGLPVSLQVHPAAPGHGIRFVRSDLAGQPQILACPEAVTPWRLCTMLLGEAGARVMTVEHLMASFAGLGIDDALVELDAAELPILDGSAAPFVAGLQRAGVVRSTVLRHAIQIRRSVQVVDGHSWACLLPGSGFSLDCGVEYDHPLIGHSVFRAEAGQLDFAAQLAPARTFALERDIAALRAGGLALGGSLANAVVVGETSILNEEGLRFTDEFARHKALDALGDLFIAGAPIIGCYQARRGGHALNIRLLRALLAQPDAWSWYPAPQGAALAA